MANLNRVFLIGNLTRDPELRYTPSGTPVATLRLAVNSSFKDHAGQRKEETCFVTIVVWSKQAELCNQYLKKGRSVCVEGRLIYRSWEQNGNKRSVHEVRADRVQFLGQREAPAQSPGPAEELAADEPSGAGSPGDGSAEDEPPF
jgi:single-strand DNA-binding protein